MMFVAIERLRRALPTAEIRVINADSKRIGDRCGPLTIIHPLARRTFIQGLIPHRLRRLLPSSAYHASLRLEHRSGAAWPAFFSAVCRLRGRNTRDEFDPRRYLGLMLSSDALVYTGTGTINDAFPEQSLGVMHEVALANSRGIPVYMFGQGVGPMEAPTLQMLAKRVLPMVRSICVREKAMSPGLLKSLGVAPERIKVTGDDAIEMAHLRRPEQLGESIGVNLRLASYAQTGQSLVESIRPRLHSVARRLNASLAAVPISLHQAESDLDTATQLMRGYSPGPLPDASAFTAPEDVIRVVGKCRVVLAGSYHAAVFALSQGVPVVAISQSPYYDSKFRGLIDMFGGFCPLFTAGTNFDPDGVGAAIEAAWNAAPAWRPLLLDAASRQVDLGNAAFDQFAAELTSGNGSRS